MKLDPTQLEKEGYSLMVALDHDELIPFLKESFRTSSRVIRWFNVFNILLLFFWIGLFIVDYLSEPGFNWGSRLSYSALGLVLSLLIIPIHEWIHSLAYKYVGARETSYDANWKKFYFMAMAHKFVANYREFRIVALAPLVVITLAGMISMALPIGLWKFSIASFLLIHSLFSSGDIALLNFFVNNREREMVTYDDKAARMSYFYEKTRHNSGSENHRMEDRQ